MQTEIATVPDFLLSREMKLVIEFLSFLSVASSVFPLPAPPG